MKWIKVPETLFAREDISAPAMLVAAALLTLERVRRRTAFSAEDVACFLEWPKRNVQRALANLIDAELVELEAADDGRVRRYQMRAGSGADLAPESAPEAAHNCAPDPAQRCAPLLTEMRAGSGAHSDDRTSFSVVKDPPEERHAREPARGATSKQSAEGTVARVDDVRRVFDHWRSVMGHERAQLDPNRRRAIERGLKAYGLARCLQAIDGCAASPFHMGQNDRGTRYDGLGLIFRNAEQTEKFLAYAERPEAPTSTPLSRDDVRRFVAHQNACRRANTKPPTEDEWIAAGKPGPEAITGAKALSIATTRETANA